MNYSTEPIENDDLHLFAQEAIKLFNTPYRIEYKNSLVLIVLAQGGALHYAVTHGYTKKGYSYPGLKDIDIWFFFKKEVGKKDFACRSKLTGLIHSEKFGEKNMDTFGRSLCFNDINDFNKIKNSINNWLLSGNNSPKELAKKAGIVIYPDKYCGKLLWLNKELKK